MSIQPQTAKLEIQRTCAIAGRFNLRLGVWDLGHGFLKRTQPQSHYSKGCAASLWFRWVHDGHLRTCDY